MIEFVTMDAKECPYCKGELIFREVCSNIWKKCNTCKKNFQIAYFAKNMEVKNDGRIAF